MIKTSLKILGKTFTSEGETIEKAIAGLNAGIYKGLGVLTLEKGDIKKEKIIPMRNIAGITGKLGKTQQDISIKKISVFFDRALFE
jgi:hypothetical protein